MQLSIRVSSELPTIKEYRAYLHEVAFGKVPKDRTIEQGVPSQSLL